MPQTVEEPEDYNLNGAKLSEQNARVFAAQMEQKRKDLEDEEALERIANTYKGKPLPDDWDPETHPLFMKDPDTQVAQGNPLAQGMMMLRVDDPPEEIAERAKQKGNYFLKKGPRYYKEAIAHYSDAIKAKSPDIKKNAIYYSNRAAVELLRKNYGKVIEDCSTAIKLDASHIKAYFRAAKAYAALEKWKDCVQVSEAGLLFDKENKELQKELSIASAKLDLKRQESQRIQAEKAKALLQESKSKRTLTKACDDRGVRLGECVYGGAVQGGQSQDPYVDEEGALHWPVLFLYDEFDQSDYFQDTHELATVHASLEMLFDRDAPPPEWDPTRRYTPDKLAVYIATNQSKELKKKEKKEVSDEDFIGSLLSGSDRKGAEREYELAGRSKWVKVSRDSTLADLVKIEDHIVGGFPVLHVVEENSIFERHLLEKGPMIF